MIVLMTLQTSFVFGIGLLLAAFNSYFRDVQHFLGIALNIWFYSTPILYPSKLLDDQPALVRTIILDVNPMSLFIDAYRDVLYHLRWPTAGQWTSLTAIAAASLLVGAWGFRGLESGLAEEL